MLDDLRHFRAELQEMSGDQVNLLLAVFVIALALAEAVGRIAL